MACSIADGLAISALIFANIEFCNIDSIPLSIFDLLLIDIQLTILIEVGSVLKDNPGYNRRALFARPC